MVGQRLQALPRAPHPGGLVDSTAHPQFFRAALEIALLPHATRHPLAITLRLARESTAWQWVVNQVRECSQAPLGNMRPHLPKSPSAKAAVAVLRLLDVCGDLRALAYHLHATRDLRRVGINSFQVAAILGSRAAENWPN